MNIVVCNWKTYVPTADEALALVGSFVVPSGVQVVVCPSFLHIPAVADVVRKRGFALGAQDISVSGASPQTGRLSGVQLLGVGVSYVLVGHAEIRAVGVANSRVADKAVHALESGIIPIVCLSEQRDEEVLGQLDEILTVVREHQKDQKVSAEIIVAYEPTEYIGTDRALDSDAIQRIAKRLRRVLTGYAMQHTPILYGGAVDETTAFDITQRVDVDGLLIGRASVDSDTINVIFTEV